MITRPKIVDNLYAAFSWIQDGGIAMRPGGAAILLEAAENIESLRAERDDYKQQMEGGIHERDALLKEIENLRRALRYCRNEMNYRIYQIEGHHDILLTGEMHAAVKMANEALGEDPSLSKAANTGAK